MQRLSSQAFRRSVKSGAITRKQASETIVTKALYGSSIEIDGDVLRFVVSTAGIDRAQDTIDQSGWRLDAYRANPVVLWAHDDCSLPIGKCVAIGVENDALKASVQFVSADMPCIGEKAEAVRRMCVEGYLSATSVGFMPIKWDFANDPERGSDDWYPGIDFKEMDLMEFSIVPVPCNAEALIEIDRPMNEVIAVSMALGRKRMLTRLRIAALD